MQYILIAVFSVWFASYSTIPQYFSMVLFNFGVKKEYAGSFLPVRVKPFDCERCLAFWITLIYSFVKSDPLILSGCVSLLAVVINLLINKLK